MPGVAELPPGWRHFTTAQKIDHLIGLDRCYEIMSWGPITELDPMRASFRWQVWRVAFMIGLRAMLDGTLEQEIARDRNRDSELAKPSEVINTRPRAAPTKASVPCSGKTGVPGRGA
jgi:hypothetical protein